MASRQAHNLEIPGSSPGPATKRSSAYAGAFLILGIIIDTISLIIVKSSTISFFRKLRDHTKYMGDMKSIIPKLPQELMEKALKEVPTMTCEEYFNLEEAGNAPTTIDVREDHEWESGHIPEATHLPLGKIEDEVEQIFPNKSEAYVICCARGGRAAVAGMKMINKGYTNVKYLSGGFTGYCGDEDHV